MNSEEGVSGKREGSHFKEEVPFDLAYLSAAVELGLTFPSLF